MYQKIKRLYELLEEATTLPERIELLSDLAFRYLNTDPEKCEEVLQNILALSEAAGYHEGLAQAYNGMARVQLRTRSYHRALEYYNKATDALQDSDDLILKAKVVDGMGIVYGVVGSIDQALICFNQALQYLKEARAPVNFEVRILNNLGNALYRKGDKAAAEAVYVDALATINRAGIDEGNTFVRLNLGALATRDGRHAEALKEFKYCLEKFTAFNHKLGIGAAQLNIGKAELSLHNYAEAIKYVHLALVSFKAISNQVYIAGCYAALGEIYLALGGHQDALEQLLKAKAIFEETAYPEGIIETNIVLADTLTAMGEHTQPLELLQQSEQLAHEKGYQVYISEIEDRLAALA